MKRQTFVLTAFAAAAVFSLAGCAHHMAHEGGMMTAPSTVQVYTATLTPGEEVPPATDSQGKGTAEVTIDPDAFEKQTLASLGMPKEIVMRHRTPQFGHIFSGDGYAAGYYSYLWSEVLDADAFSAFEETGDVFDPALARRLHAYVYAAGNTRDPAAAYRAFRGALPGPQALLRKRGLLEAEPT